jgi:phage-related protein
VSAAIAEAYDPTGSLQANPDGGMGDIVDQLREECGAVVQAIDWICRKALHFDLIMEIIEPISGDFRTVSSMKVGWANVGTALGAVGDNYTSLADQSVAVWDGEAQARAAFRLRDAAEVHAEQVKGTGYLQEQLGHIIDVSVETAHCVADGLHLISDILLELAADAAVPLVGWGKALVTGAGKVRKCWDLVRKILDAIEKLTRLVKAALKVLRLVNTSLTVAATATSFVSSAAHVDAGNTVDDTTDRAF